MLDSGCGAKGLGGLFLLQLLLSPQQSHARLVCKWQNWPWHCQSSLFCPMFWTDEQQWQSASWMWVEDEVENYYVISSDVKLSVATITQQLKTRCQSLADSRGNCSHWKLAMYSKYCIILCFTLTDLFLCTLRGSCAIFIKKNKKKCSYYHSLLCFSSNSQIFLNCWASPPCLITSITCALPIISASVQKHGQIVLKMALVSSMFLRAQRAWRLLWLKVTRQNTSHICSTLHLQMIKTAVIFTWNIYKGNSKESGANVILGLSLRNPSRF